MPVDEERYVGDNFLPVVCNDVLVIAVEKLITFNHIQDEYTPLRPRGLVRHTEDVILVQCLVLRNVDREVIAENLVGVVGSGEGSTGLVVLQWLL